jgi:hypothetical protein
MARLFEAAGFCVTEDLSAAEERLRYLYEHPNFDTHLAELTLPEARLR